MRNLYGVFAGTKFALTANKRVAIRSAKLHKGCVRVMAYPDDTSNQLDGGR